MNSTYILVFEHDVVKYPPILSFISFLFKENKNVVLIGGCSNEEFISNFIQKGGVFYSIIDNKVNANVFSKMCRYFLFKRRANKIINEYNVNEVKVYFFGEKCAWLLHRIVSKYKTVIYLFEVPTFVVEFKYRLLSLNLNYKQILSDAYKVVCCEYNRAHITKAFFGLDNLPIVIPNKNMYSVPELQDEDAIFFDFKEKIKNKKMILYQGIFNYPERRLDEFCDAIRFLPDEYVLCLMGSENDYKKRLNEKYRLEDRVIFLDYIAAPFHLQITKLAYIGILVYNSNESCISGTLNALYCAPNKIYEYTEFGIPVLSNDVPALDFTFNKYGCGRISDLNAENIASNILDISKEYENYVKGSFNLFNSVDINLSYKNIL